jgi:hypothetical protein
MMSTGTHLESGRKCPAHVATNAKEEIYADYVSLIGLLSDAFLLAHGSKPSPERVGNYRRIRANFEEVK